MGRNGELPERAHLDRAVGGAQPVRTGADGRLYWHWDPAMLDNMGSDGIDGARMRMEAAARELALPVLMVRGMSSDIVSYAGVDEFRARRPQMEFVDVAGAGHMVVGDRNDVFDRAIIEFLHRVMPPGANPTA